MINEPKLNLNKLKSYRKFPTQDYLLIQFAGLTVNEWFMYTFAKNSLLDWDKRHISIYGTFNKADLYDHYVKSFGFSKSQFDKAFRELNKKGLFKLFDNSRNLYKVFGSIIQKQEIEAKSINRKHNDTPFYYLETIIKKVDKNNTENETPKLQIFRSFVSNSIYSNSEEEDIKPNSNSIYSNNIEPYKKDIKEDDNNTPPRRMINGVPEDIIDLDSIPF